jgi:predicted Zn-dependent peptidase
MKIINYFGKEQLVYYEKLKNGLEVYILPNKNQANYHIEVVTKFGSGIKEFIPIGEDKYLKLPLGVAHFLEHKTFDNDGEDVFKFYSKTGTYINAATNYFYTKYYIDGKKSIKKNLDYLLNMIFTPYLVPSKVESEKGIIAEEIKMYDDEADWIMDYESKRNVFFTTVNEKIAGTVDSIQKIDADILTRTYNTFYQPSNMFIVMTGNIKVDDVMEVIKNNEKLNKRKSNLPITIKKEKEPVKVVDEYKCFEENIVVPKLSYSYKFNLDDIKGDQLLTRQYLSLIFSHLFGETSKFNEKVLEENLATGFYIDHIYFDNIYALSIEAESEFADLFKEEVDKTLEKINITKEDFERVKKIWISVVIRGLDHKENLAYTIVDDVVRDGKVFDQIELINRINYQELQEIIKRLDFSNKSFVLMLPKE